MKEAAQRYQYALRKFPREGFGEEMKAFTELRVSLYLNLSRCRRKTNDFGMAEEFATKALDLKPKCYEAYYARARAKRNSRKLLAALTDLQEATQLCPSNQEIKRLLARVEEECKQFQRTQQQKHQSPQLLEQTNNADNEEEGIVPGVNNNFNLRDREDELPHPTESVSPPQRLQCSSAASSFSRTLQGVQNARSVSPQSRTSSKYLREPGLIMQPTRQAQIVKTNQHLSSIQPGSKPGSSQCSTKTQSSLQHLPHSPLPTRHSRSQHVDGTSTLSSGSISTGPTAELYNEKFVSGQCSHPQHQEVTISSHSFASKSKLADRSTASAPMNFSDSRQQSSVPSGGSSSPTSSFTSASSFSGSVKGLGPDVRLKESNISQAQGTEHRPRNTPFMGITDKTARFQQQNTQSSRTWHPQASDGLSPNVASAGIQPSNFEQFSVKHYSTKASSTGAAPGDGSQSSVQAKEQEELLCQISPPCTDSRSPSQGSHLYPDAVAKPPSHSTQDSHLSHVTMAKPKRSFIESNV